MKKNRIFFFSAQYYPHIGGVEKHLYYLSAALKKRGYNICIATFINECDIHKKNIDIVKVYRIENGKSWFFQQKAKINFILKNISILKNDSIIHVHDSGTFYKWFLIFILLRLFGKKIFLTFHGWEGIYPVTKKLVLKRKIVEWFSSNNICVGDYLKKYYHTDSSNVIYGGVTELKKVNKYSNNIVYVGRLANDTGIMDYLKAWASISIKYDYCQLIICGDGPLKNKIKEVINQKKINNVILTGMVLKPELYIQDALMVLTSGYLGILESFALERPVITFYDNDLKKDYLCMWPHYDKMFWVCKKGESVKKTMEYIINNKNNNNIKNKICQAKKYALEHSWDDIANIYIRLWNE